MAAVEIAADFQIGYLPVHCRYNIGKRKCVQSRHWHWDDYNWRVW